MILNELVQTYGEAILEKSEYEDLLESLVKNFGEEILDQPLFDTIFYTDDFGRNIELHFWRSNIQ